MGGSIEFICDIRFHRSYTLPPDPETGRTKPLRISYADYGDCNSDAVVLLCGALMATRICYSPLDQLAKAYNVRIIHPDRPGVGGSDPVDLSDRISVWLEVVPKLLSHLNISHVSLGSHSGGDIYLINTLLNYPQLLHPQRPYVCFFAPWVHHSHTKVTQMQAVELLPAPWVGKFASIARFVNENVVPLAGMSSMFLQGIKGSLHHVMPEPAPVPLSPNAPSTRSPSTSTLSREDPPTISLDDPKVVEELRKLITSYLFSESLDGISADAQLFMRKPHSIVWCSPRLVWSDIDEAASLLSKIINENSGIDGSDRKWIIDAFHSEDDSMIGERGKNWFDDCWVPLPSATSANNRNITSQRKPYEYRSATVKDTDHNYLMDPAYGASKLWLQRVRDSFTDSTPKSSDTDLDPTHSNSPWISG